jgi:hypothetical protein
MKTLSDGTEVSPRSYYYLLDFNDRDEWKYMTGVFNKMKLSDLTIDEYKKIFEYATSLELKNM